MAPKDSSAGSGSARPMAAVECAPRMDESDAAQLFRDVIAMAQQGIVVLDAELRTIVWNPFMVRVTGKSTNEVLQAPILEMFPDLNDLGIPPLLQRALAGESVWSEEFSWTSADTGETRWFVGNYAPRRDTSGEVIGVVATIHDITERRSVESELRENQATLQAALDNSLTGIAIADAPGGKLRYVNEAGLQICGASAFDLADRVGSTEYVDSWSVLSLDGTPYPEDQIPLARAVRYGETCSREFMIRRGIGDDRFIWANAAPIRDDAGKVVAGIVVFVDITDQKVAERALRERERELTNLLGNLPGMAYRCRFDPDWTMLFVSEHAREITGYEPADLHHNQRVRFADLIVEGDREQVRASVSAALRERRPFELTYRIRDAGGAERWLWERGVGVFSAENEVQFLEGFISDITASRAAEEARTSLEQQLRQAQKMEAIGQLAGGVAHDFNNILTAILGYSELAQNDIHTKYPDARDLLDSIRQIESGAHRAAALTSHLLAFSRRQVVRPEVVDLNESVRVLKSMLRRLITEDIELCVHCAPNLDRVRIDPGQVQQVVMNLVVNARDAMPDGGRLTIETRNVTLDEAYAAAHSEVSAGPYVMLAVSDHGCGMDEDTIAHACEPFFTTKPIGQGTGLGLATVYGIVKQAGGHLLIYSERDQGTSIKIYLPAVSDRPAAAVREDRSVAPPTGTETIIVCEDHPGVCALTTQFLQDAGYTALKADTPAIALQLAAATSGRIHLLVTDVIMPEMNGRRLSDALRALRPEIRTLFVSGYTANVIAHHGVLDPGIELLEKPFSRHELLVRVRRVLDRPGANDAG